MKSRSFRWLATTAAVFVAALPVGAFMSWALNTGTFWSPEFFAGALVGAALGAVALRGAPMILARRARTRHGDTS